MAKSIAFAAAASRLTSLLLSYLPAVCAFVAPRQPGASTTIIDRLAIRGPLAMAQELHCSPLMKATDLLKQQHRNVEALFAKIEAGEPEALKDLASALAAHMTIEHEFFYPDAREVDEDEILEAFEEHSIAEVALKRALATDSEDASFDARVKVLKELIEHHVEEEEGELFPRVEKALGSAELEAMGKKMEARFQEVLVKGYEALLPDNFEETAADIALSEEESAA